jgi:hypothetical protein
MPPAVSRNLAARRVPRGEQRYDLISSGCRVEQTIYGGVSERNLVVGQPLAMTATYSALTPTDLMSGGGDR